MSKSITEVLEYLDLGSEKAFSLIKGVCALGITYLFYLKLGGGVKIPNELSIKVVSDYFLTFQFLIPFILYSIIWFLFSIILPIAFRLLLLVLIEWFYFRKIYRNLKNTLGEVSESDADEMILGFNGIVEYFGIEKIDKAKITNKIKNRLQVSESEVQENLSYDKIDFVVLMIQLLFLYLTTLSNTLIFKGGLNLFLIICFVLLIVFTIFLNFLQYILERVTNVITQKIISEVYSDN